MKRPAVRMASDGGDRCADCAHWRPIVPTLLPVTHGRCSVVARRVTSRDATCGRWTAMVPPEYRKCGTWDGPGGARVDVLGG